MKKKFEELIIDDEIWMAKNLKETHFRNGDIINQAISDEEWIEACEKQEASWCYYENDEQNAEKYGILYNWYAVNDKRGLAPNGWKIPSDRDWNVLEDYFTETYGNIKKSIKSPEYWKENSGGNNESGFSALPSGRRDSFGNFEREGFECCFWTASEEGTGGGQLFAGDKSYARYRSIDEYDSWGVGKYIKGCGFSVRCIKL